ncbi:MAG: hypothetical protein IIC30_03270 [Chloroflexi bacterium]|nr:hypothetical protein [Chloroflexota bacterium]
MVVVRDDAHKLKCVIAIVGPDRHRRDDVVDGHAGGGAVTRGNHSHSDALARAVRVFNINLVIVIERDIVEKHVPVTGLALGEMVIERRAYDDHQHRNGGGEDHRCMYSGSRPEQSMRLPVVIDPVSGMSGVS